MHVDLTNEQSAFLASKPAGGREVRFARAVVLVSVVVFLAAAPFARTRLPELPAFIPLYVASLFICDLVTAALLFAHFSVLRSVALLVLAGGYLFTAFATAAYALIFPGLFPFAAGLGPGPQTTSAMYMFWHGVFPLFVIAYVQVQSRPVPAHAVRPAMFATGVGVAMLVGGFTVFATAGHDHVPVFLDGNLTTETGRTALLGIWLLSLLAGWVLWRRRPHTVLDVWLMVVVCVWLFDIALAAILNSGRYDLGWYVGRIYGMVAASCLLITLLLENAKQFAHLVKMSVELGTANQALAQLSRQDGLTGLANRRHFDVYLAEQLALAARHRRGLALVLCDVDHFKAFNDRYGHQAGDVCLKKVAAALRSCCHRPADMVARYGGEEFALVLPETGLDGAHRLGEAARAAVAQLGIPHGGHPASSHVSISGGIAAVAARVDMTAQELIAAADHALYRAKHLGRDRMVGMPPPVGRSSAEPVVLPSDPVPLMDY